MCIDMNPIFLIRAGIGQYFGRIFKVSCRIRVSAPHQLLCMISAESQRLQNIVRSYNAKARDTSSIERVCIHHKGARTFYRKGLYPYGNPSRTLLAPWNTKVSNAKASHITLDVAG